MPELYLEHQRGKIARSISEVIAMASTKVFEHPRIPLSLSRSELTPFWLGFDLSSEILTGFRRHLLHACFNLLLTIQTHRNTQAESIWNNENSLAGQY